MEIAFYVDDGDILDLRVAKILEKYGFKGIFYIAPFYTKVNMMSIRQIQELSKKHEIGGHTLNHIPLSKLSSEKQFKEILEGKKELESIIGKKIKKFAYPRGHYTKEVMENVEKAGFKEARTMKQYQTRSDLYGKFDKPVTIHIYPEKYIDWKNYYFKAKEENSYFGVVCHGSELQRFNLWNILEEMLKFIKEDFKKI